jgi:hypothetical protein
MSHRIKTLPSRPNVLDQQISELRRDGQVHIELKTRPKVHDFEVRRPDVTRKERGNAVGHLVNHGPSAPPVCLDSVAHVHLPPIGLLLIQHLHSNESRFVCLEDFGRDIITCSAGYTAVFWRYNARAGNQCCSRTKVDELDMRGTVEYKVVGFHITFQTRFVTTDSKGWCVRGRGGGGTYRCTNPCEWHHATALITCGSHQRRSSS